MKTGSFGATIHFSRVSSAAEGGKEGRGVAVKKYWVDSIQVRNKWEREGQGKGWVGDIYGKKSATLFLEFMLRQFH